MVFTARHLISADVEDTVYACRRCGAELIRTSWGVTILTGALMGSVMWFNVWFVIWPRQKKVIASANGEKVENLPAAARRSFLASRTNTLMSIPLLFFMGAASHLPIQIDTSKQGTWWVVYGVIVGALTLNGIKGKTGPMTTVKGVITCGFILTVVLYGLMEVIL